MDNKSEVKSKKKWASQKQGFQESLKYLQGRMRGSIKSLRTPWPKFNDATTDGIEWNTLTVSTISLDILLFTHLTNSRAFLITHLNLGLLVLVGLMNL